MWVTSSTETALTPTAIALGNFDGIHLGHRRVLQPILQEHRVLARMGGSAEIQQEYWQIYPTVVTFNPHPREFFTGQSRKLLTPLEEKVKALKGLGVEQLVLLPFNRELANLSPQAFVEEILIDRLQAQLICIGADFCFGKDRAGKAEDLQAIAGTFHREVAIAPLEELANQRISSSRIRQALSQGDIEISQQLLDRPYSLGGKVVKGQQLGRKIGFPTANLDIPPDKFLPRYGVYAVEVEAIGMATLQGVINIGCRPTVNEGKTPIIEVHILNWSGDLYDRTLTVYLEKFLRPEQKFDSLNALKKQIAIDCEIARKFLEAKIKNKS
ncbi:MULTISPECIES: bifunctional riboflavin kinase/FAD synthetase [Spirulina sp. CCY15215]|uniref:bifunctional riboflavin kinase/FAD synthetase n=1 Tax=Spirulina sp. CCY15215 TaxID=2767591 RepID=UPI00194E455F